MLLRARGQLFSRGGGLQRESGCFFALLFERSRVLRGFRLQLHIEPRDSGSGFRRLLRRLQLDRPEGVVALPLRAPPRSGALRSLLRFGWRAGLIGFELSSAVKGTAVI